MDKNKLASVILMAMTLGACGGSGDSEPVGDVGGTTPGNGTGVTTPATVESLEGSVARRAKGAPESDLAAISNGNSNFAFDMYHTLTSGSDENLIVSPHSMSTAFAMLYAGADGNTATELKNTFHYELDSEQLHQGFNTIDQLIEESNSDEGIKVSVINSQWGEKTYDFNPDYSNVLSEYYGADIKITDIAGAPEETRTLVNDWVEEQTNDLIKNLMPENSINTDTRLVLVNAVYFNGKWKSPFPADNTADRDFTLLDGNVVQAATMTYRHNFNVFSNGNETLVELPYKGEAFSMYVMHTPVTQFSDMESDLSTVKFDQMLAQMAVKDIELSLPKFSFGSKENLGEVLPEMGVIDAFDSKKADFSFMNQRDENELFVQAAVHQAFIAVDEEGTEAAAATGISVGIESMPEQVQVNSPFVFFIRHNETGAILFMGRVLDPTE